MSAPQDKNTEKLRAQEEKVQETKEAENLNDNAEEEVQETREAQKLYNESVEQKVQEIREAQKLYNESVEEQIELVEMAFADLQQFIKDEILKIKEKQKKFLAATQLKAVKMFTVNVTFNDKNQEMYDALSKGRDTFTKTKQSILGEPSFSSGKIYFEVDVKGKEVWGVGVAEESADRTGYIEVNPENGFWMISRRPVKKSFVKVYIDKSNKSYHLYVPQPELDRVGVFVDFGKGLVTFFNVDTPDIIHTFQAKRFLKLRPLSV